MKSNIAELTELMAGLGASGKVIAAVTMFVTREGDKRRAQDRERKRRAKIIPQEIHGIPQETCGNPPEFLRTKEGSLELSPRKDTTLSTASLSGELKVKQDSKVELVERGRRGSRLDKDWSPDAKDQAFALGFGFSGQKLQQAVDEFKDFWVGVPGQRGVKLDWSATWRNRIRQIGGTNGRNGRIQASREIGGFAAVRLKLARASQDAGADNGFEGPSFDLKPNP